MAFYLNTVNVFPAMFPSPGAAGVGGVLYNDGTNSYWSYPGGTSNLVEYPYAGWAGSFILSYDNSSGNATMTYSTGVSNPVNSPGVLRYYTGTTGYKYWAINTKVPISGTYTFSYYARLSAGSTNSNLGNSQLWRDRGPGDRTPTGDFNPTFTDVWKRYTLTSYVTDSLDMFPIHSGSVEGGITIDICGFQLELGSSVSDFKPSVAFGSSFQYRSILTHGYLAGGYKGSNPWRSVNRTWHSTDITMYCGEQLAYAASYIEGTFSDYNGYVHSSADAFSATSAGTQSYSLANGSFRTQGVGTHSPPGSGFGFPTATGTSGVGGWNMSAVRNTHGCAVDQIGQVGYITGGGSAVTEKFHFPSETMYTTTSGPGGGFTSGGHGQTRGYFSVAGAKQYIGFSNNTWSAYASSVSPDGWCKILSTKLGHHYGGNGGNHTIGLCKFSDSTGTDIISNMSKIRACGEENMQMGQNWGYMLGNYDGQQNNQTVKYNYLTDSLTQLGTAAQPKGHFGQSSGCCSSAAATVASSNASIGY